MGIKRVGILRGGVGEHYASSLRRGGDFISHIFENLSDKYKVFDILIDKEGIWYLNGIPIKPADLIHRVDVVWNTSKQPGLSLIFNDFSIPYIGDNSFLKFLGNNNNMLRTHMKNIKVQMTRSVIFPKNAQEVFEKFSPPWIVKINNEIELVKNFNELAEIIKDKNDVIVEEFIDGKVASIHSVSSFRGQDIYIFYPKDFTSNEKEKIFSLIKDIHKHLGVKHYLKSNFIFHPRRGFFLTDIDFLPDLRNGSHFEQSCEFVGAKMHHVVEHILEKALNNKTR